MVEDGTLALAFVIRASTFVIFSESIVRLHPFHEQDSSDSFLIPFASRGERVEIHLRA
jgi:hypothetical protein